MSIKRAPLLLGLLVAMSLAASAQVGDLYASVTQTLSDKVLGDVQYPFTVVNMWDTFHPPTTAVYVGHASKKEIAAIFKWAEANNKTSPIAHELIVNRAAFLADLDRLEKCRTLSEENRRVVGEATEAAVHRELPDRKLDILLPMGDDLCLGEMGYCLN
jgi:hypothetical protein